MLSLKTTWNQRFSIWCLKTHNNCGDKGTTPKSSLWWWATSWLSWLFVTSPLLSFLASSLPELHPVINSFIPSPSRSKENIAVACFFSELDKWKICVHHPCISWFAIEQKNHKFDASQDVEANLGRKHIKKNKINWKMTVFNHKHWKSLVVCMVVFMAFQNKDGRKKRKKSLLINWFTEPSYLILRFDPPPSCCLLIDPDSAIGQGVAEPSILRVHNTGKKKELWNLLENVGQIF